ncbi:TOBE domain-containing protein [Oceanobacter mangrovi]|uniref:TOBE domain-containing protein n=1 Tax=Oceanobacter mangrovi TaxID=2862510 RepID=UPI001C8D8514|nr:TOBE domain-containing protein [Oceanobacter mangrovi]
MSNEPQLQDTWLSIRLRSNQPAMLYSSREPQPINDDVAGDISPICAPLYTSQLSRTQARLFLDLLRAIKQPGSSAHQLLQSHEPTAELQKHLARLHHSAEQNKERDYVVVRARVAEICDEWDLTRLSIPGGSLWVAGTGFVVDDRLPVRIDARDVSLTLTPHDDSSIVNQLRAQVSHVADAAQPGLCRVSLRLFEHGLAASEIIALVTLRSAKQLWLAPGLKLWVQIKSAALDL